MVETELSFDEMVTAAKADVVNSYGVGADKRRWLEASPENSYSSSDYGVSVLVLEGSPPKGYVLASRALGTVIAFDPFLKSLKRYHNPEIQKH